MLPLSLCLSVFLSVCMSASVSLPFFPLSLSLSVSLPLFPSFNPFLSVYHPTFTLSSTGFLHSFICVLTNPGSLPNHSVSSRNPFLSSVFLFPSLCFYVSVCLSISLSPALSAYLYVCLSLSLPPPPPPLCACLHKKHDLCSSGFYAPMLCIISSNVL